MDSSSSLHDKDPIFEPIFLPNTTLTSETQVQQRRRDSQSGHSPDPPDAVSQLQHDRQYAFSSFCGAPVMMLLEHEAPCHSRIPQIQYSRHLSVQPEVAIATSPLQRSSYSSIDPMHGGHTFPGGATSTSSPAATAHRPRIKHLQTSSGGSPVLDSEMEDVWMPDNAPDVYEDAYYHDGRDEPDYWQPTECSLTDGSPSPGGRKHTYQPAEPHPHGRTYCHMPDTWTYHPSELPHPCDEDTHHDDRHHSPEAPLAYQNPDEPHHLQQDDDTHDDGHTLEDAWAYHNADDEADEPHHHIHDEDTHDDGHTPDGWPSLSFESPFAESNLPCCEQQPAHQALQHAEEQHRHTESPDAWPVPFESPMGDNTIVPGSSSRQNTYQDASKIQTQQASAPPSVVVISTVPYHVPGLENLHDEISPASHAQQPGVFEDAVEKVCCEFDVFSNQAPGCYQRSTSTRHATSLGRPTVLHHHQHDAPSAMRGPQLSLSPPPAAEDMDANFSQQQYTGDLMGRHVAEEPCWPSPFSRPSLKRRRPHEVLDFPAAGIDSAAQQPVKVKRTRRSKKKKLPAHVALLKTVKKYVHPEN